jgi:hypothetical protein
MNWNRLFNRLKGTPAGHEQDLDEELTFHRTMKEREFIAQGMTPAEARVAALRALGNLTLTREDARAEWAFAWISDLGSGSSLCMPNPHSAAWIRNRGSAGARPRHRRERDFV